MKNKLKQIFLIFIIALLSLSATGCGKKPSPVSTTNIPTNASGKVEIFTWRATEYEDLFRPYAGVFMESNPQVQIWYDQQDLKNYEENTTENIAEDFKPHVWSIPVDWLPDNQKKLVPMPDGLLGENTRSVDVIKEKILPGGDNDIYDSIIFDNQVYALPFTVDTLAIFHNRSLFRKALERWQQAHPRVANSEPSEEELRVTKLLTGPPKTWNDLLELIPLLTVRNGDQIEQAAIALGNVDNIRNADDVVQLMIYQNGGDIVSDGAEKMAVFKSSKVKENGELFYPAREALSLFSSFSDPTKANYTWNKNMPDSVEAFTTQKVAMVIDYPSFRNELVEKHANLYQNLDMVPISPVFQVSEEDAPVNFASFSVETVTNAAKAQGKVGLAWSWILGYMKTPNSQAITQTLLRPSPFKSITEERAKQSYGSISRQSLTARVTYKRHHVEFDALFNKMIRDVTENGQPIDDAVNQTNKLIDDLLKKP